MSNIVVKKYDAIDGLKVIACLGVILVHMRSNGGYVLNPNVVTIIDLCKSMLNLFFIVSAFGMCCGYYNRILENKIDFNSFYKKRFVRVLPFFAILVLIDVFMKPTMNKIYEGFADITLVFGFTGKRLSVIGVGWFLGLIFIFYLIFPFFCVLIKNKRRAWIVLVLACAWHFVAATYFKLGMSNILFSGVFFVVGGLIYLYRDRIEKINRWIMLGIVVISMAACIMSNRNYWVSIVMLSAIVMYAISVNGKFTILDNKVFKFIAGISMEIYLSHMVIFRVVEKLGLTHKYGNGPLQFTITTIAVIAGSIVFAFVLKKAIEVVENFLSKKFSKKESVA